MWVSLSVEMPESLRRGASILWLDNDQPIGSGDFSTQSILREPGDHVIQARITTADDRRIIVRETVSVGPPASSRPAGS